MIAYLIEYHTDFATIYYCGESDWCNNPNHARKFPSREEAEWQVTAMNSKAKLVVADHMWCTGPVDPFNAAKEALAQ